MGLLLNADGLGKHFGSKTLFEGLSMTLSEGDRLGLIGPNGSGKSTLFKILAGRDTPDQGEISRRKRLRVGYVAQETEYDPALGVLEVVLEGISDHRLEDYQRRARAEICLSRVGIEDFQRTVSSLSGGFRKRLSIAAALADDPDLLLLDEPTNHLDIESILWLEQLLINASFASAAVSHDRYFLRGYANRMMELSPAFPRGRFIHEGGYEAFLEAKEQFWEAQVRREKGLATRVRREREWLGRGPKARGGKAKHRKDSAYEMIERLEKMRARRRTSSVEMGFAASGTRSKELLTAEGLSLSRGGERLFDNLDMLLSPGLRLGLVGPNGSGKTSLLACLAGRLKPDSGQIRRKDGLETVWFDQHREQLDSEATLKEAFTPSGGDAVIYRGRSVHVNAWADRFLFRREQLPMPVSRLSGGERARLLIARLMLRPADLLLLDEPTNDLDIPTLEVLEESLSSFPGALVLVTHDRYLLDRVSNLVLGLDGEGGCVYVADYWQWEREKLKSDPAPASRGQKTEDKAKAEQERRNRPKKLSYHDQREWERMEQRILEAEAEVEAAREAVEDPEVASDPEELQKRYRKLEESQQRVKQLYERWSELEAKLVS
ncbi:MAG TPA: ABC-F family ATP-binding cassette domain-containing protein [Acidobacteriota bacterium]|nr:ABC-F family ATP-binding cassette domain-containing protein [Acidobacteriota bacterium]